MPVDENQIKAQLMQLVQEAVQQDTSLREQYQIGDKFRFIHDGLTSLLEFAEEHLNQQQAHDELKADVKAQDEDIVFIHLFNAQGAEIESWKKLLLPSLFYEYSINRPVYHNKKAIEALVRYKPKKLQHGYIALVIKKEDIQSEPDEHGVIKVRDGSLDADKFIMFVHNEQEYGLSNDGELRLL